MSSVLQDRLYNEILKIPVIDTHEHLVWDEAIWCSDGNDVLSEYLLHYMKNDVLTAGLKPDALLIVTDRKRDVAERWKIVEPYWEASRFTGYGRALDISVKAIYGIDGVNRATIEALNAAFLANKRPGHMEKVIRDLCGIELCLSDVWTFHVENKLRFVKPTWQPQNFIEPSEPFGRDIFEHIKEKHGITVRCLDDWTEALEREIDLVLQMYDSKTIKTAIAYHRPLRFENTPYRESAVLFEEALNAWNKDSALGGAHLVFQRPLQDFLMHRVLKCAAERHLTVQFHTGLFEGSGNILSNGNPELLSNLFIAYPDVDFDLFHISYPYQSAACALAKMFPNVTVDMCWAHIISPCASVAALHDFLDALPYNKISAFGGDYLFVDGVYGHLELARRNVARVLAEKVESGVFSEVKALEIAKALFYDNPKRIFKL